MEDGSEGAVTATVARFRAARSAPPAVETEAALHRLESALFSARRTGKILDRYVLLHRLGQGTSGVVYLARDPRLQRNVAIKLLHPRADHRREGRARLLREAQAMARAPHPNVVAVYDVGTYDTESGESGVFIVMEYVEGPSLHAWLAEQRHPWGRVLDVFVTAGRGLAAAHRVGVTHRDFKPANVIVSDEGRRPSARVLDFGLARGLGHDDEDTLPGDASPDAQLAIDGALTAEGTVLGTPAFMAPEQHAGQSADAASDQYSFCVALWAGLYGARPFGGRSFEELAEAKRSGPPAMPAGADVPRRVGAVLVRGLAVDPAERWPTMESLLQALRRAASRRRRRWATLAVACGVGALAAGAWLVARSDRPCTGAKERVASVWHGERRSAIAEAFEAAARPFGGASVKRVGQRVDAFADDWARQHRNACLAASVRNEQAPAVLDLRMACLDQQLREVDALLAVFEAADRGTVEHAVEAVVRLPQPSQCANVEALLADVPPPADPVLAAAVEAERSELARARALEHSGRMADAHEAAEAVSKRAATLEYGPLLAEALYYRGALEDNLGRYEVAAESLERSHAVALASGHDAQAATAATQLVFEYGHRLRRLDVALEWASTADAERERAGQSDRSRLLMAMASAYHAAGRFEEAERNVVEAIALIEKLEGDNESRLATAHNNLGEILRERGELDRARGELEIGQALYEKIYGADHPRHALSLNNLANIDLETNELVRAEQRFRQVIEIREHALGPDHPHLAMALSNLGLALRRQGRLDEAKQAVERALAVMRSRGPDDMRTAGVLMGLGRIAEEQGDLQAALRHFDHALALEEAGLPPEHPDIARSLYSRAIVLVHLGDLTAARSSLDRADAIKAAINGGDAWVAEGRFAFARALHEHGELAEARKVAAQVLTELAPGSAPELQAEVEAWLADRGGRYP